jgi:hypothetical protein
MEAGGELSVVETNDSRGKHDCGRFRLPPLPLPVSFEVFFMVYTNVIVYLAL